MTVLSTRLYYRLACYLTGLLLCMPAIPVMAVDQFSFIPIADNAEANAVSADGLTVVGATEGQAFRWSEATGVELLGLGPAGLLSTAHAVSADGSVVVGSFVDASGLEQPFQWTPAAGMTALAPSAPEGSGGVATDVSNDGTIIVGEFGIRPTGEDCNSPPLFQCRLIDPGTVRAFSWTAAQGMTFLDFASGTETPEGSTAVSVSGDGSIITGTQFDYAGACSVLFNPITSTVSASCARLSNLEQQVFQNVNSVSSMLPFVAMREVTSVSSDGSTITGQTADNAPLRWRQDTGAMALDFESSLTSSVTATAASADGSIVVGDFGLWVGGTTVTASNLLINGYGLRVHGVTLQTDNNRFGTISGISDDGQTFVGTTTIGGLPRQNRPFLVRLDTTPIATAVSMLPPFVPDTFAGFSRPLLSAALPLARSTQVNGTVTAFVSLINQSQQELQGCAISFSENLPISFSYAPTEPIDNDVIGPADELFSLDAGAVQSLVIGMTPTGAFPSTSIDAVYECGNSQRVFLLPELNDIILASSTTPVPDILAESATTTNDGIANLDANNQAAFSVATLNLGAESDTLRVDAFPTGGLAAFTTSICETNPITGDCLGAAASFLEVDYDEMEERTFGVFVSSSQPIEPLFDIRRVRVQFTDDAGELRGSTSVAVVTQQ